MQQDSQHQQQPISGQQLAALQKAASDRMRVVLTDIEIRKWCVTQATAVAPDKPLPLARDIHAFLTEAAAKEIQPE